MWQIIFTLISLPVLWVYDTVREWLLARWQRACYLCRFQETSWWYWSPFCAALSALEDWRAEREAARLRKKYSPTTAKRDQSCGCEEE